ncbi:MAG: aldehyde dehydrogenase family protein [Bifidobacteriaceae bacterium]|jgi:succinate-semialdehyde dehydrogenase/glutarate-semialdehyde dehydrogenase|nr:aldehyde dehydrogenase family protein [Bifidobacteriaceae bacterium]
MTDQTTTLHLAPDQLFIRGEWRAAANGSTYTVADPATGQPLAELASTTPADAVDALDAAAEAFPAWSNTTAEHRGRILTDALDAFIRRNGEVASLLARNAGIPPERAQTEVLAAAEAVRLAIAATARLSGRTGHPWGRGRRGRARLATRPGLGGPLGLAAPAEAAVPAPWPPALSSDSQIPTATFRVHWVPRPIGPTAIVLPNEEPLATAARKAAPALAAGCTVILKPAALTPLAVMAFANMLVEAGLPEGAFNVIPCVNAPSVIEPVLGDSRLRKLSYTGDLATARGLLPLAANGAPSISLELAGPAPFIVMEDADMDTAVDAAVSAATHFNGQAANCAHRVYVHRSQAAAFAEQLAARFGDLVVGDPSTTAAQVGPLLNAQLRDQALAQVNAAVKAGATVLTGGEAASGPGFFFQPTVLGELPGGPLPAVDDLTGPVSAIVPYDDLEDVLTWANASPYGTAAYVMSEGTRNAERIGARLSRGLVAVNTGLALPVDGRGALGEFMRIQRTVLPAY